MKKIGLWLTCLILIFVPILREKTIYLTFDDGPLIPYTSEIAELLDKNSLRGTFFLVGEKALAHPDVVRELSKNGHTIGNHTYHHNRFPNENLKEALEDLIKGEIILADILGYFPRFFRPPGGKISEEKNKVFTQLGFKPIFWDINTGDYEGKGTISIVARILTLGWDGSIVLMHSCPSALKALPIALKILKLFNFRIKALPQEALRAEMPKAEQVIVGERQRFLLRLIGEGAFIKGNTFLLKKAISSLENTSKFKRTLSRIRSLMRKASAPEEKEFWNRRINRLQLYIRYSILRRRLIKIFIGKILSLPESAYQR